MIIPFQLPFKCISNCVEKDISLNLDIDEFVNNFASAHKNRQLKLFCYKSYSMPTMHYMYMVVHCGLRIHSNYVHLQL